jgi:hypothetical protein
MNNQKATPGLAIGLETFGPGVMEYRNIGVLKKDIRPLSITPILHHSSTPRIIQTETRYDPLTSLGLWL